MNNVTKDVFLHWLEFRSLPNKLFPELADFTGDAFEHMFACMSFMYQGQISIAAKHLRHAIKLDRSAIGRMAEIGALQVISKSMFNKPLMDVLQTDDIELVLEKFVKGC